MGRSKAGPPEMEYPGGASFAFTIFDDTDDGTVANLAPIYALLGSLGLRATKTVWPFRHDGPSHFFACETLESPSYRDWVLRLQDEGFEVGWHGATFESSPRERTQRGLARFRELFGGPPRVYANHSFNRENLYWGEDRLDLRPWRRFFRMISGLPEGYFQGHDEASAYWWGDLCEEQIVYARNLTFRRLNMRSINPSMPYRDPRRPLVPYWFSAADAPTVREFNSLTSPAHIDELEAQGGFTVVATHLGKGFVRDGRVHPETRRNLEYLASRPGWFPTPGQLLDWLGERGARTALPMSEWLSMQIQFVTDHVRQRISSGFGSDSTPR